MNTILSIREIPEMERPYEKLETKGPGFLSDAELLAIIIKSGSHKEKSTDLAMKVLNSHPCALLGLHHMTLEQLKEIHGIGRVKAIQLKAVAELAIRMSKASYGDRIAVQSPSNIAGRYMEEMRHLEKEELKLVLLDTKYQILDEHTLSVGTVNSSLVNPREIFVHALKKEAVNILILHNHPSGDPSPSSQDIEVTHRIQEAGELLSVKLIDHIIIGDGRFISLKEQGYMQ